MTAGQMAEHRELLDRRDAMRAAEPGLRARDLAARLAISEAELLALEIGRAAIPLRPEWSGIFAALAGLGRVMALTRNECCVHEKRGAYDGFEVNGTVGLVIGGPIDLRIFFSHWRHGFALTEETARGTRRSLQFFGADGEAIHKIYLTDASDLGAWDRLVARFAAAPKAVVAESRQPDATPLADALVDVGAFQSAWDGLTDTHQFHGLLMRFKLRRTQALRLAGAKRAHAVPNDALRRTMTRAADAAMPIMVFVGNRGMVQIHSGPVKRLMPTGPWFNVLDEDFNLHLREDAIASSWIVAKPTSDGVVTSLELFDASDELIATLFGVRKPGQSENADWRALLADTPSLAA